MDFLIVPTVLLNICLVLVFFLLPLAIVIYYAFQRWSEMGKETFEQRDN